MADQQDTATTAGTATTDATEQTCPNCGMPKYEWMGNDGQGCTIGDKTYCCQGCAIGTGCTCK